MLVLGIFLLCLALSEAFLFHTQCFSAGPLPPGRNRVQCCPSYLGSQCGESLGRGSCVSLPDPGVNIDDRADFPAYFMSHKCKCNNNYFGVNCGNCTFNYEGKECNELKVGQRQELREMTETQRENFYVQLHMCKTLRDPEYLMLTAGDRTRDDTYELLHASYLDIWVHTMYYSSKAFLNNSREDNNIDLVYGLGYLNSNRVFLFMLESQMRRCMKDPTITIPYYDWQADSECIACSNQYFGSSNSLGYLSEDVVFSTWGMTCADVDYSETMCLMSRCACELPKISRQHGLTPNFPKPATADIQNCMRLTDYADFSYCCQSMSSQWLRYVGGTPSERAYCANDPLYMTHMSLMEKVNDRWLNFYGANINSYPNNQNYGHRPTDCIPVSPHCRLHRDMVRPGIQLGIIYSSYQGF